MLFANGLVLAIADDSQLRIGNANAHQVFLGGLCPGIAQREIVLFGAALVAVAFDGQFVVGILLNDVAQLGGIGLQSRYGIGAKGVLVVVEIGVLNSGQQFSMRAVSAASG